MSATAIRAHRTQEERSTTTQRKILDATLECLATLGYAGTTTTIVAERAGVSRGAQLHHFPTRSALIGAAVQHLFDDLRQAYERAFARLPPDVARVDAAIDLLWKIHQDPRLTAVLELHVAARTDSELRAALAPVASAHHGNVVRLARRYFPEAAATNRDFDALLDLVLDTLQGMAVRRLLATDRGSVVGTLPIIKQVATAALTPPAPRRG